MKKGLKVTNVKREKKVGVAVNSFQELLDKSCEKFQVKVNKSDCRLYVAEDGTLVEDDEYLQTIPPQTLLVFVKPDEEMKTDFEFFYELIRGTNKEYLKAGQNAQEFLTTNIKEKFKVLQKYIGQSDNLTNLSTRQEDPDWFKGLHESENVKEISMGKRAKERMRGYYYKVKTRLQSSELYIHSKNSVGKTLIDQFLQDLRKMLEDNKYNSSYFNRKASESLRLCSESGEFKCGGLWNLSSCNYQDDHVINPYRSPEERIIFQTWNLDHKIELSRSIIPKIIKSVETIYLKNIKCEECDKTSKNGYLSWEKYYLQIFTKDNLKLVHIVCHYKGKHAADSDMFMLCQKCYSTKYKEL